MPFLVITAVKIQIPEIAKKYLSVANLIILHLFDLCSDEASHFISSILTAPLFSPEKNPLSECHLCILNPPRLALTVGNIETLLSPPIF